MIDIETASRSVDILTGFAILATVATIFFCWILIRMAKMENTMKIRKAVNKVTRTMTEQAHREHVKQGAAAFAKEMALKKSIDEKDQLIRELRNENQRMKSIIERASL